MRRPLQGYFICKDICSKMPLPWERLRAKWDRVAKTSPAVANVTNAPESDEKHGKLKGETGEIKSDGDSKVKIGEDGRATKVRHNTNHGNPKYHTKPHDHDITWPPDGNPIFGKPINYLINVPPFV